MLSQRRRRLAAAEAMRANRQAAPHAGPVAGSAVGHGPDRRERLGDNAEFTTKATHAFPT